MSNVASTAMYRSAPVTSDPAGIAAPAPPRQPDTLPAPTTDLGTIQGDVMAMLYALSAKQRDTNSTTRAASAQQKGVERQVAFDRMREELQKAKDAKEDGGWLGDVVNVLDAAADAVVGGNPLQDVAKRLADTTGVDEFEVAYDFIRPDAMLHGAMLLASAVTGEEKITQGYDVVAGSSSLKTRFQAVADASGEQDVMDAYKVTRDAIAMAMVTVGTCGTGTAACFAVASSTALMLESKLDVLGELGVDDDTKMGLRLGAQAYMIAGNVGCAVSLGTSIATGAKVAVAIVSGADKMSRGGVQIGQGIYEHESTIHLNESAMFESVQQRTDREQKRIISGLRELSASYQRVLDTIAGTVDEQEQTTRTLAQRIA